MEFGAILKRLRTEHDLRQEDLAKMLNVKTNTISYWENGIIEPNIDSIKKIATYFEVPIDFLLGFQQNENKDKLEELKKLFKENGMIVNDDLSIETLNKALQIAQIMEGNNNEKN